MANLLVRGVEDALVQALKKRAGAHGRSQEAENSRRHSCRGLPKSVIRSTSDLGSPERPRCGQ